MTIMIDGLVTANGEAPRSNNGACPKCGAPDPHHGYGFSPYGLGIYSLCECGTYFDFVKDSDGECEE